MRTWIAGMLKLRGHKIYRVDLQTKTKRVNFGGRRSDLLFVAPDTHHHTTKQRISRSCGDAVRFQRQVIHVDP